MPNASPSAAREPGGGAVERLVPAGRAQPAPLSRTSGSVSRTCLGVRRPRIGVSSAPADPNRSNDNDCRRQRPSAAGRTSPGGPRRSPSGLRPDRLSARSRTSSAVGRPGHRPSMAQTSPARNDSVSSHRQVHRARHLESTIAVMADSCLPTELTGPEGGVVDVAAELERAREYHRRQAWADAFDAFEAVDRVAPLAIEDLGAAGRVRAHPRPVRRRRPAVAAGVPGARRRRRHRCGACAPRSTSGTR